MKLNPIYRGIMYCALAVPVTALAQQGSSGQVLEEIVVTGSLIRGIPADAAMPVDTISADDLERQGSPPPLEMLKSLSYMNGIVGESNNFTSGRGQAAHGTASVNLRGLGEARTLVLLNGKRLTNEDINRLPQNAIGRVEVLKDGGAVTYGSDAIAGVVNYITKTGQDGFELSADYRAIDDSDGDYNIGLTWGVSTDNSDFFAAFNYYHRSELKLTDVDYAIQPYSKNPEGGWGTGANPGGFRGAPQFGLLPDNTVGLTGWPTFIDPACGTDYGVLTDDDGREIPAGSPGAAACRTQYTQWYNLIDEQDTYQAFASYDLSLGADTNLRLEALYASTEVDHASSAPSYTTANYVPNAINPYTAFADTAGLGVNPFYAVGANNPGLLAWVAEDPVARQALLTSSNPALPAGMAYIQLNQWRPYFAGGNPAFGYGEAWTNYDREQYRLSAELDGMLTDSIGYRTSLSYSKSEDERQEWDIRIDKLQAALLGFGGETGNLWLNPFASAYPGAGASQAAIDEQIAVAQWLMERHTAKDEAELIEFNFIVDGELPVEMDGGTIGWAAGIQYRHESDAIDYWAGSDQSLQPCPDYTVTDAALCPGLEGRSPWTFLATYMPYDLNREVKAIFGEMIIPFTDNFTAQIAARFEDYGNDGGDSFDPHLRLRWQATDWMALRASVGTTFRAPAQASLRDAEATAFQAVKGNSTPVGTRGNSGLKPEEATNYNLGLMFTGLNHEFTIDYWRFEIDKRLSVEPLTGVVEAFWPTGGAMDCSSPLLGRFDLSGTCGDPGVLISGVHLNTINGGEITNDGIDIAGRYTWDEIGPGSLTLGGSATWINEFKTEALTLDGIQVEAGFDGVGRLNSGSSLFPLPELRGNLFLDYAMDNQNIRWTMNYVDSYVDNRDIFDIHPAGRTIDSHITHNVTYRLDVNDNVTITAVVDNLFDEEPPFARTEMNYDPVTHSPLLRTFKVGARVRF